MQAANVLVVFYSRTGFTRSVAQKLARALGADLEELMDMEYVRSVQSAVIPPASPRSRT
jgi:flavodoxin